MSAMILFYFLLLSTRAAFVPQPPVYDSNQDLIQFDDLDPAVATPSSIQDLAFTNWEVAEPGYHGPGAHLTPASTFQSIRIADTRKNASISPNVQATEHYNYYTTYYRYPGFDPYYEDLVLYAQRTTLKSLYFGCALPTTSFRNMVPTPCAFHITCINYGPHVLTLKFELQGQNSTQQSMQKATFPSDNLANCQEYLLWATSLGRKKRPKPVLYIDDVEAVTEYVGYYD